MTENEPSLYLVNGCLRPMPEGYIKLAVPKTWLMIFANPDTFELYAKGVRPPDASDLPWDNIPSWVIEDPHKFIAWFLFRDEHDAIEFKLKYL
jgi:hypothetical protein